MRNQRLIHTGGHDFGGSHRAIATALVAAAVSLGGCASHGGSSRVGSSAAPTSQVLLAGTPQYERKVKALPITPDQAYARVCAERDRRNVLGLDVCYFQCVPAALVDDEYEFPEPRRYARDNGFKAFCVNGRTGMVGFIDDAHPVNH